MNTIINFRNSKLRPGEMSAQEESGMFQYQIRKQSEVAAILGITRSRVQQIERSALIKIRRALRPEWEALLGSLNQKL